MLINLSKSLICFFLLLANFALKNELRKFLVSYFLKSYGYKIGVKNVYSNLKKDKIFETWFVRNKLNFKTIDYKYWIKKY